MQQVAMSVSPHRNRRGIPSLALGASAVLCLILSMYNIGLNATSHEVMIDDASFFQVPTNLTDIATVVNNGIVSFIGYMRSKDLDNKNSSLIGQEMQIRRPSPFDVEEYRLRIDRERGHWGESTRNVIFYNIYVSQNITEKSSNSSRASIPQLKQIKGLLREQINQVRNSPLGNATLYFNIFGKKFQNPMFWCPKGMDCRMNRYLPVGGEVDTLQDLYDFCVDNPEKRVTYLHSKGSFNNFFGNERTRRLVTTSVVSDACLSIPHFSNYPCNVCTARFEFSPRPHSNGNMWTSECNYVRKLIPPKEFEPRRREMFKYLQGSRRDEFPCLSKLVLDKSVDNDGNFNTTEICQSIGLCRYAMETWIFSHPNVIPCNALVGTLSDYTNGFDKWTPRLSRVFVRSRKQFGIYKDPWFLKRGRLWEMEYHYGQLPSTDNRFFQNYDRISASEVKCNDSANV